MEAKLIQKYKKYGHSELLGKAKDAFNAYIRERDKGMPCINCSNHRTLQAGHFYPTSTHGHIRFHEWNVNGECKQCNYFNSQSHSYGYAVNLPKRIGKENFEKLQELAGVKTSRPHDRFTLIETIVTYKAKLKALKNRKPPLFENIEEIAL